MPVKLAAVSVPRIGIVRVDGVAAFAVVADAGDSGVLLFVFEPVADDYLLGISACVGNDIDRFVLLGGCFTLRLYLLGRDDGSSFAA